MLEIFQKYPASVYAVMDSARNDQILAHIVLGKEKYESLYGGEKANELEDVAPYLVEMPPRSTLIETLINEGWGNSWGIFIISEANFKKIRNHLRNFLIVDTDQNRKAFFRFYDPRVFRHLIPTFDEKQLKDFFGPVKQYLMEPESGSGFVTYQLHKGRLVVHYPAGKEAHRHVD